MSRPPKPSGSPCSSPAENVAASALSQFARQGLFAPPGAASSAAAASSAPSTRSRRAAAASGAAAAPPTAESEIAGRQRIRVKRVLGRGVVAAPVASRSNAPAPEALPSGSSALSEIEQRRRQFASAVASARLTFAVPPRFTEPAPIRPLQTFPGGVSYLSRLYRDGAHSVLAFLSLSDLLARAKRLSQEWSAHCASLPATGGLRTWRIRCEQPHPLYAMLSSPSRALISTLVTLSLRVSLADIRLLCVMPHLRCADLQCAALSWETIAADDAESGPLIFPRTLTDLTLRLDLLHSPLPAPAGHGLLSLCIAAVGRSPCKLRSLSVQGPYSDPLTATADLSPLLSHRASLRSLSFRMSSLPSAAPSVIGQLSALEHLDQSGVQYPMAFELLFAAPHSLTKLRRVRANQCLGPADLVALASLSSLTALPACGLHPTALTSLPVLSSTQIRALEFVSSVGQHASDATRQRMDWQGTVWTNSSELVSALTPCGWIAALHSLSIRYVRLEAEALTPLVSRMRSLRELSLVQCTLDSLSFLSELPSLESLAYDVSMLGDADIARVMLRRSDANRIVSLPQLRSLSVSESDPRLFDHALVLSLAVPSRLLPSLRCFRYSCFTPEPFNHYSMTDTYLQERREADAEEFEAME